MVLKVGDRVMHKYPTYETGIILKITDYGFGQGPEAITRIDNRPWCNNLRVFRLDLLKNIEEASPSWF